MTAEDPLEEFLQQLNGGSPLADSALWGISGLEGDSLARFQAAWEQTGTERRIGLIWQLIDATAENLAFDFSAVCAVAVTDPDPTVREQAYRLLAEDGSVALFEPALKAATEDPDHEARTAAIDAVGVFTLQAQVDDWPQKAQDAAQRVLLNQLRSPESDLILRQAALLSLSHLTTAEVEAEIRQAYQQPDMRQTAIEAMGRNCQEVWLPDLRAELRSDQSAYRLLAVLACVEMEDERLIPDLVERVEDPEREVRLAAIQAMGAIGGDVAEAALTEIERSSDPALRRAAAGALAEAAGRDEFFAVPADLASLQPSNDDDDDYEPEVGDDGEDRDRDDNGEDRDQDERSENEEDDLEHS